VGITEAPDEIFGKIMSIPDELMWSYYELVTDRTPAEIAALRGEVASGKLHPMDAKMKLGQEIIAGFHGEDAAQKAADNFQRVFRDRQAPDQVQELTVKRYGADRIVFSEKRGDIVQSSQPHEIASTGKERWSRFLALSGHVGSVSEGERLIKQKGFEINGEVVSDPTSRIDLSEKAEYLVRIGKKKFLRIVVE